MTADHILPCSTTGFSNQKTANTYPPIFLIGLMGSGKSTVGRRLAKQLNFAFFDCDSEIVDKSGVAINTIFEIEGEHGFRERESAMLQLLAQQNNAVIATGGGAVIRAENRALISSGGFSVYLDVPPALLAKRTRNDHSRPLLAVANPLQRLLELHRERDPWYRACATLRLNAAHGSVHTLANRLKEAYWHFLLGKQHPLPHKERHANRKR